VGEAQLLWTSCAAVLREQVSEAVWLSSFAETTALRVDEDRLVLCVPSPWVKERIESRYLEMVRAALTDVGASREIEIEVRPDAAEQLPAFDVFEEPPHSVAPVPDAHPVDRDEHREHGAAQDDRPGPRAGAS